MLDLFNWTNPNIARNVKWCFNKSKMYLTDPLQGRKHPHIIPKKCLCLMEWIRKYVWGIFYVHWQVVCQALNNYSFTFVSTGLTRKISSGTVGIFGCSLFYKQSLNKKHITVLLVIWPQRSQVTSTIWRSRIIVRWGESWTINLKTVDTPVLTMFHITIFDVVTP